MKGEEREREREREKVSVGQEHFSASPIGKLMNTTLSYINSLDGTLHLLQHKDEDAGTFFGNVVTFEPDPKRFIFDEKGMFFRA